MRRCFSKTVRVCKALQVDGKTRRTKRTRGYDISAPYIYHTDICTRCLSLYIYIYIYVCVCVCVCVCVLTYLKMGNADADADIEGVRQL